MVFIDSAMKIIVTYIIILNCIKKKTYLCCLKHIILFSKCQDSIIIDIHTMKALLPN